MKRGIMQEISPGKIHTFNHPEFGQLRVFENEKGELHFSLEDVARNLGMSLDEAFEHVKSALEAH